MSYQRITKYLAIAGISFFILAAVAQASGLRFNATKSIPVGLYWVSSDPIEVGSYVMFCPPVDDVFIEARKRGYLTSGFCDGKFGYMMKKVLAAKNDSVTIDSSGVYVNSNLLALSEPLKYDGVGAPLPRYSISDHVLNENEILLMSDVSGTSFDGRYYGFIDKSQIRTVIKPLVTW